MADIDFSSFPDQPAAREAAIEQAVAGGNTIKSGWIPPQDRTAEEAKAHADVMSSTPNFLLVGKSVNEDVEKVVLWDCWAAVGGFKGFHQSSGACVGVGAGNAVFSLAAADKVRRQDPARVVPPCWLLPYGISRMLGGLNDRGDGSFGSTMARAVREYGILPSDEGGLPQLAEMSGMLGYGSKVELDWSQGKKIPSSLLTKAKSYLVRSTAQCRTTDDVRDAVKNYFAVTCASNWGGQMQCPVKGEPGVLLNRRTGTWMHQMSIHGYWDHPSLGPLFYVMNTWGTSAHGTCPSGAPKGGFWVVEKDVKDIVSQKETFAFSQFDDFPAVDEPLDFGSF